MSPELSAVFNRVVNKSPVRRTLQGAGLTGKPRLYYDIVKFIQRRCNHLNGGLERRMLRGQVPLPANLHLVTDLQVYQLNWTDRLDKRYRHLMAATNRLGPDAGAGTDPPGPDQGRVGLRPGRALDPRPADPLRQCRDGRRPAPHPAPGLALRVGSIVKPEPDRRTPRGAAYHAGTCADAANHFAVVIMFGNSCYRHSLCRAGPT